MPLNQAFLGEYDQEMAVTRKTLERVPEGKLDWRPHPKSGTMAWLAGHVANLPSWITITFDQDSLDLEPGGAPTTPPPPPKSTREILDLFEKNQAAGRKALAAVSDEQLMKPWTLLKNGKPVLTLPRIAVLRSFVLNHLIHHRGQLCVYLRLNDVPVPSVYGPSADEAPF